MELRQIGLATVASGSRCCSPLMQSHLQPVPVVCLVLREKFCLLETRTVQCRVCLPVFHRSRERRGAFEFCPNDGSSRLHGNKVHGVAFQSTLIFIVMVMGASVLVS